MNIWKKLFALTLALVLALSLAACGSGDTEETTGTDDTQETEQSGDVVYRTLDEIKESGVINIGVFSDKNPFGLCGRERRVSGL